VYEGGRDEGMGRAYLGKASDQVPCAMAVVETLSRISIAAPETELVRAKTAAAAEMNEVVNCILKIGIVLLLCKS
jgi:hypothetical protein